MRSEEFKRENKYLVVKWADVEKYLSDNKHELLLRILQIIGDGRTADHKNPSPNYVVVNQDEPYAEKVWELIKEGWFNDRGEK